MGKLRYLPNCITSLRIIGTIALIFTKPLEMWFYIVYLFTGITDVFDGFLARKLNVTSKFGAKLDSISDLLFYAVSLVMILPILWEKLPTEIWYGVAVVLSLRLAAYILAAVKLREFAASHSYLNKITGFCVFLIPFVLSLKYAVIICWIFCGMGLISSGYDFILYLIMKPINRDKQFINNKQKV